MKRTGFRALRFAKRLVFRNFGLKLLSFFLACHIYHSMRPGKGDGGKAAPKPAAAPLLPMVAQPEVQTVYVTVTNTVTIVSNAVPAALAPAAQAPAPEKH